MQKTLSLIASLVLIIGILFLLLEKKTPPVKQNPSNTEYASIPNTQSPSSNVTIKDGIQYITIDIKRGYSPQTTRATGGILTKLIAKTQETYDCSSALVIRSVKYQAYLPATANTEINLGTPKSGDITDGVCGMGMYSFQIQYI